MLSKSCGGSEVAKTSRTSELIISVGCRSKVLSECGTCFKTLPVQLSARQTRESRELTYLQPLYGHLNFLVNGTQNFITLNPGVDGSNGFNSSGLETVKESMRPTGGATAAGASGNKFFFAPHATISFFGSMFRVSMIFRVEFAVCWVWRAGKSFGVLEKKTA